MNFGPFIRFLCRFVSSTNGIMHVECNHSADQYCSRHVSSESTMVI